MLMLDVIYRDSGSQFLSESTTSRAVIGQLPIDAGPTDIGDMGPSGFDYNL